MSQRIGLIKNKYLKLVIIAGLVIVIDQITKLIVSRNMELFYSIPVIPGFFSITFIHNTGGAFGFMADMSPVFRIILFNFMPLFAIFFIFYFYKKTPETYSMLRTGFSLILGGAIGNMIDRFRFGKVVDFLDFYIGNIHWPAFNAADSAISIGIGIFIFHIIFKKLPQ